MAAGAAIGGPVGNRTWLMIYAILGVGAAICAYLILT